MTSLTRLDGSELVTVRQNGVPYLVTIRDILQTVRDQDVNVWEHDSLTLRVKDQFTYIKTTSANPVSITVPPSSLQPFTASAAIGIEQGGAGQVTIVAGAGVTVNSPETLKSAKQYAVMSLIYLGNDVWTLGGHLELSA